MTLKYKQQKKIIDKLDCIKVKNACVAHNTTKKLNPIQRMGKKHLHILYLIKDLYLLYIKNSNLIIIIINNSI